MKKWLQNWLGINPDLEQERYIATQAQLNQLTRGLGELTEINTKLAEATEKLAEQVKLNSDEINGIKEALEYITKDIVELKRASKAKAQKTSK